MKKILFSFLIITLMLIIAAPLALAEEFVSGGEYPTKLVYDEETKKLTIQYAGPGGWNEFMPVSGPDSNGEYNYDIQNFIDKYRETIEHIEIAKFGKIQLIEIRDESKAVVDGAKLFSGMTNLKSVHFAVDQRIQVTGDKYGLFEGCTNLTTVWFGSDKNKIEGCANFTGCNIKDDDNAKGNDNFSKNLFKGCSSLKNIIYTKNPNESVLFASTFEGCTALDSIKIGDNIKTAPAELIKAYKFIDLESGEGITELASGNGEGGDPSVVPGSDKATVSGHSTGEYNGKIIIDTYWAYYAETKTLEFSATTGKYNETGTLSDCDIGSNWADYINEIEHIIVGNKISKITVRAFMDYPALKDVRIGKQVTQIDPSAFENCSNLTTVWRDGKERVEGRADFRGLTRFMDCMIGTSITEVILPENPNTLEISMPMTIVNVYSTNITEDLKAHAKENVYNLINLNNQEEKYEYWTYIDPSLPYCGKRAVYAFDEATGLLTVYGAGEIDDIVNYHGGGSKNQPWFAIKQQVKNVVITDHITAIGKYAFAEFENLETVQLPNIENLIIRAAAFEGCVNLKSVYIEGSEPIEGTLDLRMIDALEAWTFAYDYLIANVVVSPKVDKIGTSVFSDNINLANIYGTPGSYAEEYANKNGLAFFDISSSVPEAIKCIPPVITEETETTALPESTADTEEVTTAPAETEKTEETQDVVFVKRDPSKLTETSSETSWEIIIIGAIAVAVATAAVIIIIVLKKKKNS